MRKLLLLLLVTPLLLGAWFQASDVIHADFNTALAAGWFLGDWPTAGSVNKFGHSTNIDTTETSVSDISDLGGPQRCFTVPGSTAAKLYLSSDDENDGSGNDGISITVEYVNSAYVKKTIDVALGAASASGTVFVQIHDSDTAETIFWINRMFPTTTASSGNIYAGTEAADDDTDGIPQNPTTTISQVIDLVEQQTMTACYMVPANHIGLLHQFIASTVDVPGAPTSTTFRLRRTIEFGATRTVEPVHVAEGSYAIVPHVLPIYFAEKTAIELTGVAGANDSTATGTFDIQVLPNTL